MILSWLCELLRVARSRIIDRQRKLEAEIAERQRTEADQRQKAEELRVTLASIADAVITTDASGRVSYLNNVAERLTGWTLSQAIHQPLPNVFHIVDEQTRTVIENPAERALLHGSIVGLAAHTLLISREGEEYSIDDSAAPIRDASGRVIGTVLVFRDVSERKRHEQESQLQRQRLELAQSAGRIGSFEWDIQTGSVEWSPMEEELYGLAPGGFGGSFEHWRQAVHPEDRDRAEAAVRHAVAEKFELRTEFRIIRPDGAVRWIAAQGKVFDDERGHPKRMVGVNLDITPSKLAELRIRLLWEAAAVLLSTDEPDAMLRQLFAKIGPHLKLDTYFNYMVDEEGDGLALESCMGIPREMARGIMRLSYGQAICGTVALTREPIVATHIQEGNDPKAELVKSLGIRCYACHPLLAGNKLLGTLSFASRTRDEFDDDEIDFLRTICRYVTTAYERLQLIRQLQDADRRKNEFLATLAHELRNPLAPIRNGLQVIKLTESSGETAEAARSMMERQVDHMVHLIDDLLDLSRISRGKLVLRKQRIELGTVIKSALETCQPLVQQFRHQLTTSQPATPIWVEADPVRLAQALGNLLSNAAKYSEPGGKISLTVHREGDLARVSVKDSGVGIPMQMLPRIFDMFTQVDQTLEKSHGGLGIGLTIVKQLIELHGGTIEARSDGPGQGSEFSLALPTISAPTAAQTPSGEDSDSHTVLSEKRRILVVDDNQDSAHSLAALLRFTGMEVQTAHDGFQAVERAGEFRPEMILLDIGMPGMNGYDTCRRLREAAWGQEIFIVAMTGWGQDEDRERSEQAGFDMHLVKPVEFRQLQSLIADLKSEPA
ncbi:MAG: ATP-binding protein [Planctomycetales bacterium]